MGEYADTFEFNMADFEDLTARLKRVEKLMRSNGFKSTEALLDAAAETSARLEAYYEMEGAGF